MKSILILLFLFFNLVIVNSQSVDYIERCLTTQDAKEERMEMDPAYKAYVEKIERSIKEGNIQRSPDCAQGRRIIPVAIHFDDGIVPPDQELCMIELAKAQIVSLNQEINGIDGQNLSYSVLQACFGTGIGNSCLEFAIASINHPAGYDLNEGQPAITFGKIDFSNTVPVVPVPIDPNWSGYLNIFVGDLPGAGVSAGIPGAFNGEGVLINTCQFGIENFVCFGVNSSGSCGGIYDEGNTLAHEVGHYLGLKHIWGDSSNCGQDDGILDTPPMSSSYLGYRTCLDLSCQDLPSNCGSSDMYMNYMSYSSDRCMYMFSSNQADKMYQVVSAAGWTTNIPNNCSVPQIPVVDFNMSSGDVCLEDCISLTDMSTNDPTSWNWTFSVTSGDITLDKASSSYKDPQICVATGSSGTIDVTLVAGNIGGSGVAVTKSISVTVTDATDLQCVPCTEWASPVYVELYNSTACILGCPVVNYNGQIGENEAYRMPGLKGGVTYTLEFCTGYSPANWEAVITIVSFESSIESVIAAVEGCSISFTAPSDGNYLAIISGKGNCGGPTGSLNGFPSFTCNATQCNSICGTEFTDIGGPDYNYLSNQNVDYVICPDGTDAVRVKFLSITTPVNCNDGLELYNGTNSSGMKIFDICGSSVSALPQGGVYESSAVGECLTFKFTSNNSDNRAGWRADIICCDYTSTKDALFNPQECEDIPVNNGENFSFTFNNNCTPAGTITDISTAREIESTFRTACEGGPTYPNQVFYLFKGKNSIDVDQDIEINCVVNDLDIKNVQIALYGPTNIDCPGTIEPGMLLACDQQANESVPNGLTANANISVSLPADGSDFLLVVATDGTGSFNIDGQVNFSALPVDLVSFEATPQDQSINLDWTTASETNNQGFEILKGVNELDEFENIGFIEGFGDSRSIKNYDFIDRDVIPGISYYYKLKQLDFDGNFSISPVVQAEIEQNKKASIYPSLVRNGYFNIIINEEVKSNSKVEIYTMDGRLVKSRILNLPGNYESTIDDKGIFFVKIESGGEILLIEKIVVL